MPGKGSRKSLARLLGNEGIVCAVASRGPCSGEAVKVSALCAHGHDVIGDGDHDTYSIACAAHWWEFATVLQRKGQIQCGYCEHCCDVDVSAEWEDDRKASIHLVASPEIRDVTWDNAFNSQSA